MPEWGRLLELLEQAQRRGFLGPEPVQHHVEHSSSLADAIGDFSGSFLDLGSGGGVPGLVLAMAWPRCCGVLVDARRRRCIFLHEAVRQLELADRLDVRCGRAETLARLPELRGIFDLVVARGFARPAVTAECAVGFLRSGGKLVVTEPPEPARGARPASERWPAAGLRSLGLSQATPIRAGSAGAVVITADGPPSDRWPRGVGRPSKSPRW